MQEQVSVALELFRGVYDGWQAMPTACRVWRQNNIHGVGWRSGAYTLELLVNVSTLRSQRLEAAVQLWRDTLDVECELLRDIDVNLVSKEGAWELALLCSSFLAIEKGVEPL